MAAAKLPAAVTVGPYTYTIITDELERLRAQEASKANLGGQTDHDRQVILISERLAAGMTRETLLHELLHVVANLVGLSTELGRQKEETIVRRLSPALVDLLRRNPAVVAFLLDPEP